MTPEETAAAAAAEAAKTKTPEQLAADTAAADAAKKAGAPPATNADGTPKVDQVDKDGKPIVQAEGQPVVEEKAPEKYELKLDGITLDKVDVAYIEQTARENNLSNESAQTLLEQQQALAAGRTAARYAGYLEELTADKTYGGAKLEETQRFANAALDKAFPKGDPMGDRARAWLSSGNGNHIVVAALLSRFGRMTLEDGTITGEVSGGGDTKTKTAAEHLYGDTPKPSA